MVTVTCGPLRSAVVVLLAPQAITRTLSDKRRNIAPHLRQKDRWGATARCCCCCFSVSIILTKLSLFHSSTVKYSITSSDLTSHIAHLSYRLWVNEPKMDGAHFIKREQHCIYAALSLSCRANE